MKFHSKYKKSTGLFIKRISFLLEKPIFISLTLFGNLVIFTGSFSLYLVEKDINPKITSYLDTLWWAMATVTTVGYGDVTPSTPTGKIIGIFMMIVGTALFWSYTALFADAIISKEVIDIEMELKEISQRLSEIDKNELQEKQELKNLVSSLKSQIDQMHDHN